MRCHFSSDDSVIEFCQELQSPPQLGTKLVFDDDKKIWMVLEVIYKAEKNGDGRFSEIYAADVVLHFWGSKRE